MDVKTGSKIKALQLICPAGFYGAERWVVALANNIDADVVCCDLAMTVEPGVSELELPQVYERSGFHSFKIPMKNAYDPGAISALVELIRTEHIEIVHTHGYKSDILGLIAARRAGVKCISTPHGFGKPESIKHKAFIKLGKISLRFMDAVVPLSQQLIDEVKDCGVAEQKIRYVQNGVDLTELDDYLVNHVDTEVKQNKVIGYVGQLIPRKNVSDLLDIFEILWAKDKTLELRILGDGAERQKLEEHAAKLSSSQAIHFLGFRQDRLEEMKSFDVFVMTSIDEGIPRCLMEAMAMRLPVAAYDIRGVDQLVKNESNGLLSPFGEKSELASQIERILQSGELARSLGYAGRETIDLKFSGRRMASEYAEIYASLFSG